MHVLLTFINMIYSATDYACLLKNDKVFRRIIKIIYVVYFF